MGCQRLVGTGLLVSGAIVLTALPGCAEMDSSMGTMSPTAKGTAAGAGLGAVAGAVLGGDTRSAAIGGLVGAAGGYVWSRHMQDKKAAMERATAGSAVQVTRRRTIS